MTRAGDDDAAAARRAEEARPDQLELASGDAEDGAGGELRCHVEVDVAGDRVDSAPPRPRGPHERERPGKEREKPSKGIVTSPPRRPRPP